MTPTLTQIRTDLSTLKLLQQGPFASRKHGQIRRARMAISLAWRCFRGQRDFASTLLDDAVRYIEFLLNEVDSTSGMGP